MRASGWSPGISNNTIRITSFFLGLSNLLIIFETRNYTRDVIKKLTPFVSAKTNYYFFWKVIQPFLNEKSMRRRVNYVLDWDI